MFVFVCSSIFNVNTTEKLKTWAKDKKGSVRKKSIKILITIV